MPHTANKATAATRQERVTQGDPGLFDVDPEPAASPAVPEARQPAPEPESDGDQPESRTLDGRGRPTNRSKYKCAHCAVGHCERCPSAVKNGGKIADQLIKEGSSPEAAAATPCACARKGHQTAQVPELAGVGG